MRRAHLGCISGASRGASRGTSPRSTCATMPISVLPRPLPSRSRPTLPLRSSRIGSSARVTLSLTSEVHACESRARGRGLPFGCSHSLAPPLAHAPTHPLTHPLAHSLPPSPTCTAMPSLSPSSSLSPEPLFVSPRWSSSSWQCSDLSASEIRCTASAVYVSLPIRWLPLSLSRLRPPPGRCAGERVRVNSQNRHSVRRPDSG